MSRQLAGTETLWRDNNRERKEQYELKEIEKLFIILGRIVYSVE